MSSSWFFSQCNIIGKNVISLNEKSSYVVENAKAQCDDCHLWKVSNDNSRIEGDMRTKSIAINPLSEGKTVLSLSVLTSKGMDQCSKEIEIVKPVAKTNNNFFQQNPERGENGKNDCNVDVNNFKEIKFAANSVSFVPNIASKEHDFLWTATYTNGEKRTSNYTISQFAFTKDNTIKTVSLEVKQGACVRTISKNYEGHFWMYF